MYAHFKRDGWRIMAHRTSDGQVNAFSRRGDLVDMTWVRGAIGLWKMPANSVVTGELWCPGEPASSVANVIATKDSKRSMFEVFQVDSLPEEIPLGNVQDWCWRYDLHYIPFYVTDPDVPRYGSQGLESDVELLKAKVGNLPDVEGFVFKTGNWSGLEKWKPIMTADLRIVGFKEGNGKYLGLIGSMICADLNTGKVVASVGGFTDDLREQISANEEKYIGQIVEVEYQQVATQGRLRHPRFSRFREDLK